MVAVAMCLSAVAHEFWLDASAFRPRIGEIVKIRTMVGDGFPGESRPRDPTKLERFEIFGPDGPRSILGQDGVDPAGMVRIANAGTYVIGYRSKPTKLVLAGAKFEKYLKEKGLENAAKARRVAGTTESDGRERFSRCAKAVLCVGDDHGSGFDHVFGFPLEVVPQSNPYASHSGDELSFVVLADGKPVAGMMVTAWNKDDASKAVSATTSERGKVTFKLDARGLWLINAVQMKAVNEAGGDCDWESLWASVTFDLDAAPVVATEAK